MSPTIFHFAVSDLFSLVFRTPTTEPCKPGVKKPPVAEGSEVYKMLQENQESDEPPRQSASFKVLQEILETGKNDF